MHHYHNYCVMAIGFVYTCTYMYMQTHLSLYLPICSKDRAPPSFTIVRALHAHTHTHTTLTSVTSLLLGQNHASSGGNLSDGNKGGRVVSYLHLGGRNHVTMINQHVVYSCMHLNLHHV